ncbi:hypothetical protein [Streptomyces sp. Ag109_O5-10]|uniref:hypothetical protein n=1 Tax=Streptomyces sp. Ag109_O5-10 TaxID=1855349 RepID=UPI00115FE901|nr:hypothetical protein [Streptomyces sp. Ag109_O5-10]
MAAFLAVIRADEHREHPAPTALIPFTGNETQRLFALPAAHPNGRRDHRLRWSLWRRRDQPAPATAATADARPRHDDPQLGTEHQWTGRKKQPTEVGAA